MIVVKYRWLHIPDKTNGEKAHYFASYRDAVETICRWNTQQMDKWAYIIIDSKPSCSQEQWVIDALPKEEKDYVIKMAG